MIARTCFCTSVLLSLLAAGTPLGAQEAPVVYASYYTCGPTGQRLNAVIRDGFAPALDRAVADGTFSAWGWLTHHTGGTWDRAGYVVAPNVNAVLTGIEGLVAGLGSALQDLDAICPEHEDYIWERVAGSQSPGEVARDRPSAAISTYWVCDIAREGRADTLVTQVVGPILNEQVSDGDIASWTWFAHVVGGKYRRLAVTDGADAQGLLTAQAALVEQLEGSQRDAFREFGEICTSHQDYVWTVGVPAAQ
ncbi:MAG TPA: hypothetical protein VIC56_03280 [Gemmatimonadota bacterium]|jgi:hypothetical protein